MSYENVKLWFAKDEDNNIVTIDEIKEKNNTYTCPVCGSPLNPKAIDSLIVTPHFAHVDASKCNNETMMHWWFKHKFIEPGDKFSILADKENTYICKNVLVEQSYITSSGTYKPDVTINTECGEAIYFEMNYSNKKKIKDYIDNWLDLKNTVVEIDIKKLMLKDTISTFKAIFFNGKCFYTKRNDTYYNTIGKHKEEKMKDSIDDKTKRNLQRLDWFWDDIFRYRKGKVSIEHIVDLIDSIDGDEKLIVDSILNKQSCINIVQDYKKYKEDKIIHYRTSIIDAIKSKIAHLKNVDELITENESNISEISVLVTYAGKLYEVNYDSQNHKREDLIKKILNDIAETSEFLRKADICDHYNETADKIESNLLENDILSGFIKKLKKIDFDFRVHVTNIKPTRKYLTDDISTKGFKVTFKLLEDDGELLKKEGITIFSSDNLDIHVQHVINSFSVYIKNMVYLGDDIYSFAKDLQMRNRKYDIWLNFEMIWIGQEEVLKIKLKDNETYFITNLGLYSDIDFTNKISSYDLKLMNAYFNKKIESTNKNIRCSDCYKDFNLDFRQIKFFKDKGFVLPKRCKVCRQKRKQQKERNNY